MANQSNQTNTRNVYALEVHSALQNKIKIIRMITLIVFTTNEYPESLLNFNYYMLTCCIHKATIQNIWFNGNPIHLRNKFDFLK